MDTQLDIRFKRAWAFFSANALNLVLSAVITAIAAAFVIPGPWVAINVLAEILECQATGRAVRWQATYERTSTFFPALGLSAITFFGVSLGLICCVVPGVMLAIAWFHAPVLVAQGRPVLAALGESARQLHRSDDWIATLLNALVLVACALATSLTALLTVIALPLALAYLAFCTTDTLALRPPVSHVGEPIDATA